MKKWKVWGTATVTVGQIVEAETEEEAIEKAYEEWPGITGFCGNGGNDKLIGVYGEDSSIAGDGAEPEFMEAEERS